MAAYSFLKKLNARRSVTGAWRLFNSNLSNYFVMLNCVKKPNLALNILKCTLDFIIRIGTCISIWILFFWNWLLKSLKSFNFLFNQNFSLHRYFNTLINLYTCFKKISMHAYRAYILSSNMAVQILGGNYFPNPGKWRDDRPYRAILTSKWSFNRFV